MRMHHTIPKKYKPHLLYVEQPHNLQLNEEFNKQYETIFFKHLKTVITNNVVCLEINKARLQSIIHETELFLAKSSDNLDTIREQYEGFLKENKIINHQPNATLKVKLQSITPTEPTTLNSTQQTVETQKRNQTATTHQESANIQPTTLKHRNKPSWTIF